MAEIKHEECTAEELEEDHVPVDLEAAPPTFAGRLNIASFAFSPAITPKLDSPSVSSPSRQTPRISSPPTSNHTKRKSPPLSPPSPSKKRQKSRSPSKYAPPSTYAHLPALPDVLAPNLIVLFIGLNPGITTSTSGHAYAHPSNLFWKLLYSSGCTDHLLQPSEDKLLPELYQMGNTNIVSRATRNGAELRKQEMDDSVGILEEKIVKCRPEAVCLVGKGIWESVWRVRKGRGVRQEEFRYGWQDEGENMGVGRRDVEAGVERQDVEAGVERQDGERKDEEWKGAKVFVACSTSGLSASLKPAEKEKIWRELGVWVERRRGERAAQI